MSFQPEPQRMLPLDQKTMTSNGKQFAVTGEMLTAVERDQESQRVFQNLLLFCFVLLCNKSHNDWILGKQ